MSTNSWREHTSDDGRLYYYNKTLQQSKWNLPEKDTLEVWNEKYDKVTKKRYYVQIETKASQWEIPENSIIKPFVKKQKVVQKEEPFEATIISDKIVPLEKNKQGQLTGIKDIVKDFGDTGLAKEDEQKVSELSNADSEKLIEMLEEKDAIMERNVMNTIETFLVNSQGDGSGPELVVKTLAESYRGYAQMCALVGGWLDLLMPTESEMSTWEDLLYGYLKGQIVQRYQPELFKHVLDEEAEPQWLQEMLEDSKWRMLLIELAEKHKTCGLLNYCVQRISAAGHHKEIASVTSAATYFSVFHGVFTDALETVHTESSQEISTIIASLVRICGQSAYTYMYTQELLRKLEEKVQKVDVATGRKVRRIRQELQNATYNKKEFKSDVCHYLKRQYPKLLNSSLASSILCIWKDRTIDDHIAENVANVYGDPTSAPSVAHIRDPLVLQLLVDVLFNPYTHISPALKTNVLYILSYAVCANDERPLSDVHPPQHPIELPNLKDVSEALNQASILCKSDHTLGYNINQSGVIEELSTLMKIPVVSMGVLHWIHIAIQTPNFYNSSLFHACFPAFLRLIRLSVDEHPLQWSTNFNNLVQSLRLHPDLNPIKALDLKRDILKCMVHMITRGYAIPVLRFVKESTDELDQALLRNFVSFLMDCIKPPYSSKFASTLCSFLTTEKVQNALKTCPNATQKQLLSFTKVCKQTPNLVSKNDLHALKSLKSQYSEKL